jgi:hypothetical protein
MLGGETLSSGVMIRTGEAGLIHYEEDADIVFVRFRRDTINRRKPHKVRFPEGLSTRAANASSKHRAAARIEKPSGKRIFEVSHPMRVPTEQPSQFL